LIGAYYDLFASTLPSNSKLFQKFTYFYQNYFISSILIIIIFTPHACLFLPFLIGQQDELYFEEEIFSMALAQYTFIMK